MTVCLTKTTSLTIGQCEATDDRAAVRITGDYVVIVRGTEDTDHHGRAWLWSIVSAHTSRVWQASADPADAVHSANAARVRGGSRDALSALLGFLAHDAETYRRHMGPAPADADPYMFGELVASWAYLNDDELWQARETVTGGE